jgi:hypothetical protein
MRFALSVMLTVAVVQAGTALATASPRPVLRLGAANAVRGSHFKAHELVRVVFTSEVRRVRVIRVSAAGSFASALPARTDSCSGIVIRATGASGDVASIALSTGLCPPPSASSAQGAPSTPSTGDTSPAPPSSTGNLPDPHGPATINPG